MLESYQIIIISEESFVILDSSVSKSLDSGTRYQTRSWFIECYVSIRADTCENIDGIYMYKQTFLLETIMAAAA